MKTFSTWFPLYLIERIKLEVGTATIRFEFGVAEIMRLSALARAAAFIPNVTCQGNQCSLVASLIWIGWDCGNNPLCAVAGAEIQVECVLPKPGDITAFKDACRGLGEFPAPIFLGQGWSAPKKKTLGRKKKPQKRRSR